ncbi:type II toxin-antitoxin system HicA family toxin [Arabiibacter massiliensis]|uniref:type II toxin-antitoxin system HicA family toxin n=1 Tax=Arabiibacter massiliensis TaxID=1870985 RepID=UPI0009B95C35|nr:type II toxin-antitoxin system HicA family toxin [Arabiibacter massiliensis]
MTRVEKLVERLMSRPRTFRFDDAVRVMSWHGFELDEKGKTSGSRVRFYRESDGRILLMHMPHPSGELKAAAVREMASFLEDVGRR